MVFVYIRIYYAARARARRSQENKIKRKLSQTKEQQQQQQQLEQQQQQRRLSKPKTETPHHQQQPKEEELEMKPIKVAVLAQDGSKDPRKQQSSLTNNGNAQSDRPLPPALVPASVPDCSRGSLTKIQPLVNDSSETIDIRRHSLSTGDVELRSLTTNWGPWLSVDRLSVFDGSRTHRKSGGNKSQTFLPFPSNGRKASNFHLTAPSRSLTAINEFSSTTRTSGDDCQKQEETAHIPAETSGSTASPSAHQPVAQRPSSLKNGGDRTSTLGTTRHCVTFECLSVESSVTYSTVKCFNGDQQQPPPPPQLSPSPTPPRTPWHLRRSSRRRRAQPAWWWLVVATR
jgi:hypothetical protein